MHQGFLHNGVNKCSHHAAVVLSANAHISSTDGDVSYFREIAEGGPLVCIRLLRLPFCFAHVVIPEVRVFLGLDEEMERTSQNTEHV